MPEKKYIKLAFVGFVVLTVSVLRAWSIFNYSTWSIDEEQIVIRALGFLNYDFNPRWFGYHTLPMYILSAVYFVAYYFFLLSGQVVSNIDFASSIFSNDAFFFISGRIVFSTAHTLGCFVLAFIIRKKFKSTAGAGIFLILVFFLSDSFYASNICRVDTFVFLFLTLTIYFSCFTENNRIHLILSIIFCTAAFASKLPAIVFFPILFVHQTFLVYKGVYPKSYLLFFLPVPQLTVTGLGRYCPFSFFSAFCLLSILAGQR